MSHGSHERIDLEARALYTFRIGTPPYRTFPALVTLPEVLEDGTVVVVSLNLEQLRQGLQPVVAKLRRIRDGYPGVVLGGTAYDLPSAQANRVFLLLGKAGLRLRLEEEPSEHALRAATGVAGLLTRHADVWLTSRLRPKGLVERGVVSTLAHLVSGGDIDERSVADVRRWLKKLGLPTWHSWETFGRLARGLTRLQADPQRVIRDVAGWQGFADESTFSRACSEGIRRTTQRDTAAGGVGVAVCAASGEALRR